VRSHIRVEQQLKIAAEALQQKLEEKERDRARQRREFKAALAELKHDKRRYVELLELRES
jgi:uncharacterized protein YPO0396